jgi:hypothetical protein
MALIAVLSGSGGIYLAIRNDALHAAAWSASFGILAILLLVGLRWRSALERVGFYGVKRELASTPSYKWGARGGAIGGGLGSLGLLFLGRVTGLSVNALLGCLLSFLAGVCVATMMVQAGLLAATELKWRWRNGA